MSSSLIFPSLLGLVGVGGDNASLSRSSMSIREWCISPFALNFNLCLFYTVKMAQKSSRNWVEIGKKLTEWCKTLNSKADSNIFGKFWECTGGTVPRRTSLTTIFGFILKILMFQNQKVTQWVSDWVTRSPDIIWQFGAFLPWQLQLHL